MIKAIFFDIDGTLVSHTKNEVSRSARAALSALEEKGICRVIATGRHLSELASLPIRDLDFDGYITLNGQLCYDKNRRLIFGRPIEGAEKQALITLFRQHSIPLMLIEADRMYINFIDGKVLAAQASVSAWVPKPGIYTGAPIYQAVAFVSPEEKEMLEGLLPGCQITYWTELAVDIVPESAGKVAGIQRFLNQSGICREETMAFGDGENDTNMLQFVRTGIAMGNGDPSVKSAADYITDSVDEDGIYNALRHFEIL